MAKKNKEKVINKTKQTFKSYLVIITTVCVHAMYAVFQ